MHLHRLFSTLAALGLLLGVHKGYIALRQEDSTEPIHVFPYLVSMLPERDQQLLEAGIPIENESMLHRLLEDYLS